MTNRESLVRLAAAALLLVAMGAAANMWAARQEQQRRQQQNDAILELLKKPWVRICGPFPSEICAWLRARSTPRESNGDEVYMVAIVYTSREYSGRLQGDAEVADLRFFEPTALPDSIGSSVAPVLQRYAENIMGA